MKKETTIPLEQFSKLKFPLKLKQVTLGVSALIKVTEAHQKEAKKTPLFKDDAVPILIQVVPIKVPTTEKVELRVALPHSLSADRDVVLIVKNLQSNVKPAKPDKERTILHYKKLLTDIGLEGSMEVLPIAQLCDEHQQYEAKGKFAQLYDTFLVDGRMIGIALRTLGSRFTKAGKHLIPVNMNTKGLKQRLEVALTKSVMTVHTLGDTFTMKVAHTGMTKQQISENILTALIKLCEENMFPGGVGNIRSVRVKTARSMAIPIYLSTKKANSVVKPVNKIKLPKAYKVEEGELTTVLGGVVRVNPEGDVHMRRVLTREDHEMLRQDDSDDEVPKGEMVSEDESEDEDENVKTESKPLKRKMSDDEESDDDEEVVAAENTYMNEWQEDFESKKSDEDEEDQEESASQTTKSPKSKNVKKQRKSTK